MKCKLIVLGLFLFVSAAAFSQTKGVVQSLISRDAAIRKYHSLEELQGMTKGELIKLYGDQVTVLVKILPYIALAKTAGVTITDLGIPNDPETIKIMEAQTQGINDFVGVSSKFQAKMLPYSEKSRLVASILFYENTMKTLFEFEGL
ncbi:MAG: hypothetical protein ACK4M4_08720 [Flavobacterium sp.]